MKKRIHNIFLILAVLFYGSDYSQNDSSKNKLNHPALLVQGGLVGMSVIAEFIEKILYLCTNHTPINT
jgi:hypothetical protein